MKWFSIIPVLALAFVFGACEKHPVADLPPEGATAFGEHAWSPNGGNSETTAGSESAAPAKSDAAAPVAEGKSGETPKFFPENK